MWWKRKSAEHENTPGEKLFHKVSGNFRQYVLTKEEKVAGYLQQKINGLSHKGKLLLLVTFCSLFGGISLYLVLNTFLGSPSATSSIKPASIKVPQHLNQTGEENIRPEFLVTEEDIKQVRLFRLYMDTLRLSAKGKEIYDSILKSRPGLMDTVNMLEQLYLLQQKK